MKARTRLSRECIRNRGRCCEDRITLVMESGVVLSSCSAFREPYCSIYNRRPLDCRVYPVTVGTTKSGVVFLIDRKCPAVRKRIVSAAFIKDAMAQLVPMVSNKDFMTENTRDNRRSCYDWVNVKTYLRQRDG